MPKSAANTAYGAQYKALAAADRDGDGCAELWIGAPGADDGRGAIYVVSLGP